MRSLLKTEGDMRDIPWFVNSDRGGVPRRGYVIHDVMQHGKT